ncbi:LysR family transcriptional regulator [Tistrella mobilis]|uniref:LysR family transcriptional regulator n=1 Tax=Tistrella mobilis (strain KA081020-065) TaxID=1110502 RepID=I3TLZ6_TISMK|nr:LysR family transcriptional regulator [Tistrella mobilis]AFK53784.1 LysR family transcriptional regulator [Tistrella mobilis KA081020-065]
MTLEQLRIFVAVAEHAHVTRAARALNLTQSTVSAAIAALEARHGVALFHRVGRGIELAETGRIFLEEARAVLARAAAAEQALADLAGNPRGRLRIHASQTVANYWLPARLIGFMADFPAVAVEIAIGNTAEVAAAVRAGTADLGFVEGPVEDPSLSERLLPGDRLMLVVGAGHPWAALPRVAPGQLAETPWVLRERGSGTRAEFEVALAGLGVDPDTLNVVLELPSNESVRAAVEAGAGATALSALVVAGGLALGSLRSPVLDLPQRAFHLLLHRERYLGRAARAFLETVTA